MGGGLLGGVIARRGQQDQECADLLVGEPVPVHLGVDDAGHQVVAGVGPPELGQFDAGVGDQHDLVDGVHGAFLERAVLVVAHAEQLLGGRGQRGLVGLGDPEHVGDGGHRQPRRTRLDEVDIADADQVVDDLDRVGVDLLVDAAQVARGERRADQPPVGGVLWRVHHQEEGRHLLHLRGHRIQGHAARRGEQLRMLTGEDDVLAPGQRPESGLFQVEQGRQRRMPAQPVAPAEAGEGLVAHVERLAPEVVRGDVVRAVLAGLRRVGDRHWMSPS